MPLSISLAAHRVVTRNGLREPQLLKLASGDLLLTYHVQADMHFSERQGLRSRDGGRTWRKEPRRGHREQAIGQSPDGVVFAPDIYTFERRPGEYHGSFFRSDDGGATFSGPHPLRLFVDRVQAIEYPTPRHVPPEGHVLRKFYQPLPKYYAPVVRRSSRRLGPHFWRYIIKHKGRWLASMACKFHGDQKYRSILAASHDDGRTWRYVSTIAYVYDRFDGDGYCEPALIETPDGGLLCVMRWGGGAPLGQCRSLDGGLTWTEPEKLAGHGVDPDLCLMSNGVLACTYGRPGLHIMFSEDGCGYSWGYRTQIGDFRSSCYMGIIEVAPGELLVTYDQTESNAEGSGRDPKQCRIGSVLVRVRQFNPRSAGQSSVTASARRRRP